jgi:ubiquinone/menaquinone biosynthesis C-methylase UbiE
VEGSDITYPIVDKIVDFLAGTCDRVSASYDKIAPRYDGVLAHPTLLQRILNWVIWGSGDDNAYVDAVLSYLPSQFEGVLLDVPVGTGVFTGSIYKRHPNATIVAVDSSMGMLRRAKREFERQGVRNAHLVRADVAHLPLADGAADMVLSMNGWHAFPEKPRAIAEIRRVLCTDGRLIACGYVKGDSRRSDFFVKHFGVRRGYFSRPLFELGDLASHFEGFTIGRQGTGLGVAYFEAIKTEA